MIGIAVGVVGDVETSEAEKLLKMFGRWGPLEAGGLYTIVVSCR